MNKRGALFYVIDALVASAIIVVTISMIFGTTVEESNSISVEKATSNYIVLMSNVELFTIDSYFVDDLIINKLISNSGMTVLEAVVELYHNDNEVRARDLLSEVTNIVLEPEFSVRVKLVTDGNNIVLFEKQLRDEEKSQVYLTRQRVVSFKQEQIITTKNIEITDSQTGTEVCENEDMSCLYIREVIDLIAFKIDSCDESTNGWFARCRSATIPKMIGPDIIEVEVWV